MIQNFSRLEINKGSVAYKLTNKYIIKDENVFAGKKLDQSFYCVLFRIKYYFLKIYYSSNLRSENINHEQGNVKAANENIDGIFVNA